MNTMKKRINVTCANSGCGKEFSILPRTDGKPQRSECFTCKPRHVFSAPK